MQIQDPILIVMFPRSGSSLLASLFAHHGVWTGKRMDAGTINPKGFFENPDIKEFLTSHYGTPAMIHDQGQIPEYTDKFYNRIHEVLRKQDYDEGSWLFKCNSVYYRPFVQAWPNTKIVCARRNPDAILKSVDNAKLRLRKDLLDYHIAFMEEAVQQQDGVCVNYENIVKGDYSELQEAFKYCGVRYDQNIVNNTVEPKLKHF